MKNLIATEDFRGRSMGYVGAPDGVKPCCWRCPIGFGCFLSHKLGVDEEVETFIVQRVDISRILVARQPGLGLVRVIGRGSFQNAGCLKSFYQQLLGEGVTSFAVDLSACGYLDSTFLGTLLDLGLKIRKITKEGKLFLLNVNNRNVELLKNLGLDRLFQVERSETLELDDAPMMPKNPAVEPIKAALKQSILEELAANTLTREQAGPTILDAHEKLMDFDPRNVPKFKDVVKFLREDLHTAPR